MKRRKTVKGNISKTRLLRPSLGKDNDSMYNSTSSSTYGNCIRPTAEREKYFFPIYQQYRASRNTPSNPDVSAWPLGSEAINSHVVSERNKWSNCVHIKQQSIQHPYGRIALAWDAVEGRYASEYMEPYRRKPATGLTYWKDACNMALYHSLSDEQMFSARAFWSMRPKFQSDVSLINSFFELKDFKDVAKYLFSPNGLMRAALKGVGGLRSLGNSSGSFAQHVVRTKYAAQRQFKEAYNWLSDPGPAVGDIVSTSSKVASNAVLTYNLAVMPTIRDAMAIHAAAQKDVYELARNFQKYGEEGSRSHYSEEAVLFNSLTFGSYNNALWGSGKYIWQKRSAMMVSYYQTLWQRLEDRYPKWWGLEIGADEIWNMLPMSFVADYFLTIGKSLEYMDIDKTLDVHHVDYLESVKTLATSGIHYLQNARTSHLIIDGEYITPRSKDICLLVTGTKGSYYKRQMKEPYKGPALPRFKVPSSTQTANILALVRCLLF